MNVEELGVKIHLIQFQILVLIYDVWKYTPTTWDVVNFAKDYQKDSYNFLKIIENFINDKNILATLKKHSYFLKCGILKLKILNNVSKLLQIFKVSKVFYHI
jgi:hypothetical protein